MSGEKKTLGLETEVTFSISVSLDGDPAFHEIKAGVPYGMLVDAGKRDEFFREASEMLGQCILSFLRDGDTPPEGRLLLAFKDDAGGIVLAGTGDAGKAS